MYKDSKHVATKDRERFFSFRSDKYRARNALTITAPKLEITATTTVTTSEEIAKTYLDSDRFRHR